MGLRLSAPIVWVERWLTCFHCEHASLTLRWVQRNGPLEMDLLCMFSKICTNFVPWSSAKQKIYKCIAVYSLTSCILQYAVHPSSFIHICTVQCSVCGDRSVCDLGMRWNHLWAQLCVLTFGEASMVLEMSEKLLERVDGNWRASYMYYNVMS